VREFKNNKFQYGVVHPYIDKPVPNEMYLSSKIPLIVKCIIGIFLNHGNGISIPLN
jgi:hypothetical protein